MGYVHGFLTIILGFAGVFLIIHYFSHIFSEFDTGFQQRQC